MIILGITKLATITVTDHRRPALNITMGIDRNVRLSVMWHCWPRSALHIRCGCQKHNAIGAIRKKKLVLVKAQYFRKLFSLSRSSRMASQLDWHETDIKKKTLSVGINLWVGGAFVSETDVGSELDQRQYDTGCYLTTLTWHCCGWANGAETIPKIRCHNNI